MQSKTICPVCHTLKTSEIEKLIDYPAIVFPVDEKTTNNVATKDLIINRCYECTHIFQSNINMEFNEKLYTEYYKFYPYSNIECFVEHYRKPFENIFSSIVLNNKRLLEIGVSSAKQLSYFEEHGFNAIGITPQETEETNIISSFYEAYKFDQQFDVIISRFNLEHIVDIDFFMKKVHTDLEENGLFIVQVPNTDYFMQANILNFYAHEHIHYFNKESLLQLFKNHNLSIEVFHDFQSPSIIIVGRKIQNSAMIFDNYLKNKSAIEKNIQAVITNSKGKIVFYGASLSLTRIIYSDLLNEVTLSNISLVDDNPLVHGKYMPQFDVKIQSYNSLKISEGDTIILTLNEIYHKKIIDKLRGDGIKNIIYCINNFGLTKDTQEL